MSNLETTEIITVPPSSSLRDVFNTLTLSRNSPYPPFRVEFVCSPGACVGSLWELQLPPTLQSHALG